MENNITMQAYICQMNVKLLDEFKEYCLKKANEEESTDVLEFVSNIQNELIRLKALKERVYHGKRRK